MVMDYIQVGYVHACREGLNYKQSLDEFVTIESCELLWNKDHFIEESRRYYSDIYHNYLDNYYNNYYCYLVDNYALKEDETLGGANGELWLVGVCVCVWCRECRD